MYIEINETFSEPLYLTEAVVCHQCVIIPAIDLSLNNG